jgi:hypothetical protein
MRWLGRQAQTLAVFGGRAAAEQQFISDRCSQVRVARRSFQPEAQSELKLAIDWYEYRKSILDY